MSGSLEHVRENEVLSARAFNALVDQAKLSREERAEIGGRPSESSYSTQRGIIDIKNASGEAVPRFGILGLDDTLLQWDTDAQREFPRMIGVTPEAGEHEGRFAICLRAVDNDALTRAVVSGVTVCKVDMQDAEDQFADITDGECEHLTSGASGGARILAVQPAESPEDDGTGIKWAIVRFPDAEAAPRYILIRNDTGVDLERFEAVGIGRQLDDPSEPLGSAFAKFRGETLTPSHYAHWCVLQQAVASGETGIAVASGLTYAKLTKRLFSSTGSVRMYVDVHPDPDTSGESHEQYQVATRAHGFARYLRQLHEETDYHLICLGDSRYRFEVVPAITEFTENVSQWQAYPIFSVVGGGTFTGVEVDNEDPITIKQYRYATLPRIGYDDGYGNGMGVIGTVEATMGTPLGDNPEYRLVHWPDRVTAIVVNPYDWPGGCTGTFRLLNSNNDPVGDEYTAEFFNVPRTGPTGTTVVIRSGEHVDLVTTPPMYGGGHQWYYRIDGAGFTEPPYGTVRMTHGTTLRFGWLKLDADAASEHGYPNMTDRFPMGGAAGPAGGYRYHGDVEEPAGYPNAGGVNNHQDHAMQTIYMNTDVNNDGTVDKRLIHIGVPNVTPYQSSPITLSHGNSPLGPTDNRPPFETFAFSIRHPETGA